MQFYNLLGKPEKETRDASIRTKDKLVNKNAAMQFSRAYFDGERAQGYGGYHYDGRWIRVAEKIIERYGLNAGSKVLDVGCAKGFLLYDLLSVNNELIVNGVDISEYARDRAPESVKNSITICDCVSLPFPDYYFDAVTCINTIHNLEIDQRKKAISKLNRVVKNKKNIFLQVDAYETEKDRQELEE